jgi:checkpoint serine/threonine-protein kinase
MASISFFFRIDLQSKVPIVQLIDFGTAIDMRLFFENTTFKKVVYTDGFTCIEMLEGKPWTYQTDLFGLAASAHVMLFGKYMEVEKDILKWNIKSRMPRYIKKTLWENFFTTLLNIRNCNEMPNLQSLRAQFLEEIYNNEKYTRDKILEFNKILNR